MRALALLLTAVVAILVVSWLAPEFVPAPLHAALQAAQHAVQSAEATAISSSDRPMWPDAVDPGAKTEAVLWRWVAAGAVATIGLALAFVIWRLRGKARAIVAPPAWLTTARTLAQVSSDRGDRARECAFLEKTLLPDMKQRGEAALARAHQLDLYWRYVGRHSNMAKGAAKGAELARFRETTRKALDALALPPTARAISAMRQSEPRLWVLEAGDARELKRYYDQLGPLLDQHIAAVKAARAAADKPGLDQAGLFESMENLRQINRTIAKETAALVGDIEIAVRALD